MTKHEQNNINKPKAEKQTIKPAPIKTVDGKPKSIERRPPKKKTD